MAKSKVWGFLALRPQKCVNVTNCLPVTHSFEFCLSIVPMKQLKIEKGDKNW